MKCRSIVSMVNKTPEKWGLLVPFRAKGGFLSRFCSGFGAGQMSNLRLFSVWAERSRSCNIRNTIEFQLNFRNVPTKSGLHAAKPVALKARALM